MQLRPEVVLGTMERAKRERFHPQAVAARIGEGDRSRRVGARQKRDRLASILRSTGDPALARITLERIIRGDDLVGINYLSRGVSCARSVCRIRLRNASGESRAFGTGFLIAPGIVMTNHHVICDSAEAEDALAEFDYERDVDGKEKPIVSFSVVADSVLSSEPLDFCIARLAPRSIDDRRPVEDFGWLALDPQPGKTFIGEYLTIIQHPGGEPKQICVRENKLLKYDESAPTLWYETDTVAGSSGSPVFNQTWQVVALHHSGVPETDRDGNWLTIDGRKWDRSMDESQVHWIANEGMRVSSLVAYLETRCADNDLARAVVGARKLPLPPSGESVRRDDPAPSSEVKDGELRVTLPVRISVSLGDVLGRTPVAPSVPSVALSVHPPSPLIDGVESVSVNQSDYSKRPGYDPAFLGSGARRVPLPKLTGSLAAAARTFTVGAKKQTELKYWDYSVVLHKSRRLAIIAAVNVDASQRPSGAGRDGDRWFFDTRIPQTAQIGTEFYPQQKTFEADRSKSPFDRGHLVRRLDAQWGSTSSLAKRNGDDSFHWTNCSPQHWQFNQGAKRWLGLEDYVIQGFAGGNRACVLNGCVFDAPVSTRGPDGIPVPVIKRTGSKDPTFGGVSIPKLFFKVVVCQRPADKKLGLAAFLMSQEDLLAASRIAGLKPLPEERLSDAEARLYQVSLADIETLTALDFGSLSTADTKTHELAGVPGPRPVENLSDIQIG